MQRKLVQVRLVVVVPETLEIFVFQNKVGPLAELPDLGSSGLASRGARMVASAPKGPQMLRAGRFLQV